MNPPKCSDDDYINFVIATPRSVSATEAAKVQGAEEQAPAHDAFTRLLHRLEPDAETLWDEARSQISLSQGILVIITSGCACERFSDWKVIAITVASVGLKRRLQSSEKRCALTSLIRSTCSSQLRNF